MILGRSILNKAPIAELLASKIHFFVLPLLRLYFVHARIRSMQSSIVVGCGVPGRLLVKTQVVCGLRESTSV